MARWGRRFIWFLLALLALAALALLLFQERIGEALFARGVESAVARDIMADLPDGLHVALCGTSGPLAAPGRAATCTAVIAGERIFIVDSGGGSVRTMGRMGIPMTNVEGVFLTHYHSDHIDGLGELLLQRWAGGGHDSPLPVHGPEGVEQIVEGLNTAYAQDISYRVAHHGEPTMPPGGAGGEARPFAPPSANGAVVYEEAGLRVTAFAVPHEPVSPAVGYRFDYKGRSVVISGDTAKTQAIANMCNGCDILVHEVLNAEMVGTMQRGFEKAGRERLAKIMSDIPEYHATPVEAAEIARAGRAKLLLFSHLVPPMPTGYLKAYYMKGVGDVFDGETVLGEDGMLFSLPAEGEAIARDHLL